MRRKSRGRCCKSSRLPGVSEQQSPQAFRGARGQVRRTKQELDFADECDPNLPVAEEFLELQMVAAMRESGIRGELIHAYRRTGIIVTEDNHHLFSNDDHAAWQRAIAEYFEILNDRKMVADR
jgi:hypothetical protein